MESVYDKEYPSSSSQNHCHPNKAGFLKIISQHSSAVYVVPKKKEFTSYSPYSTIGEPLYTFARLLGLQPSWLVIVVVYVVVVVVARTVEVSVMGCADVTVTVLVMVTLGV